jgi:hypothetical protein
MKYPLLSILAAAALAATAASAHAETVIKNISTGFDDTNNVQLNDGDVDTDWSIVAGGTAGHVGDPLATVINVPGPWVQDSDSTASRWISVITESGNWGIDIDPGTYQMQTTVNIGALGDYSTIGIHTLRFLADDKVQDITINGTSVYSPSCPCPDYDGWITLDCVGLGLFTQGSNNITFTVLNGSSDPLNPSGLRVEGTVAVDACVDNGSGPPVPEPTTAGLVALSAVGLLARFRRSRA